VPKTLTGTTISQKENNDMYISSIQESSNQNIPVEDPQKRLFPPFFVIRTFKFLQTMYI